MLSMSDEIRIIEIQNRDLKSSYTREVLEALPEWFGNRLAMANHALWLNWRKKDAIHTIPEMQHLQKGRGLAEEPSDSL